MVVTNNIFDEIKCFKLNNEYMKTDAFSYKFKMVNILYLES